MHTYRKTENGPWTTGFEQSSDPCWRAIADFDSEWKAAFYASFLNGGTLPAILVRELWHTQ